METFEIVKAVELANVKKEVKIFVIDDDPMYRQVLEHQLRKNEEYKIFSFKTGEECFKHLSIINPDLIVLDYRLNDINPLAMNGMEILKRLKNLKPEMPVLMLSGKESFEVAVNSIKHGAFDYVVKNETAFVRLEHLIAKARRAIQLQKIARKQEGYGIMLILAALSIAILPLVLVYLVPKLAAWITIIMYLSLFYFINKREAHKYFES